MDNFELPIIRATVELFSGIGGFRLAAQERNIQTVWANDSCPKACNVYQTSFGNKELKQGDIRELVNEIPPHDLLTAGFPCQPFSSAGKKDGVRDPRGNLFEIIVDILRKQKPSFFILENVKRLLSMEEGNHFAKILSQLASLDYHIEWRVVNAMDFGLPQNRQRVVIIGALQNDVEVDFPLIRLASTENLSELPESSFNRLTDFDSWLKIKAHSQRFPHWGIAKDGRFFGYDFTHFYDRISGVTLRTILESDVDTQFDFTESTLKRLQDSTPVNHFVQGVQILYNQVGGARMGYTVFGIDGVAPTLTSTTSRHYERYKIGNKYRRLTNVEYARIQGFPDNHCAAVSIYDQYALFGNAIPPVMVGWVMDCILENRVAKITMPKFEQLQLFSLPYAL
ncbi:DNA cytosine methyltransferase [Limnofasciculus baicalensis]|uniref:Cytosine-specific methyltransferase n=1 Tax=Limnofasciculus baicalensis BBK-W-15 TaxID=2699891 RepID=A0AAE3GST1_9CYAN|nr:DNA cytosine methyltransferase [Limnofasciculus baicalensis]MCP2729306.1 DNA cytosine methyltransferase [Limnofasciculus baicalensis BBK-W-15]